MDERERALTPNGRPIFVASYSATPAKVREEGEVNESAPQRDAVDARVRIPLRRRFPEAGAEGLDGQSDGYEYRTIFAGSSLENSLQMVREFLQEEGYAEVPLPRNAEELLRFRLPTRNKQILMFEDNGYVHNPVKILFPLDGRKKNVLILCLYNEDDPNHLLKFHGVADQ